MGIWSWTDLTRSHSIHPSPLTTMGTGWETTPTWTTTTMACWTLPTAFPSTPVNPLTQTRTVWATMRIRMTTTTATRTMVIGSH